MRGLALGLAVLALPSVALAQSSPQPVATMRPPYNTHIILNGDDVRRLLASPSPSPSPKPKPKPTPRRIPKPKNTVPPPDVFHELSN